MPPRTGAIRPSPTIERRVGAAGCSPGGSPRRPTRSATWSATPTPAITARSRGTPGTSRSSAASSTPTTATGPIRRSWFGWISTTSSARTRSPTTGPGSRSEPRCGAATIRVSTHAADGVARAVREYRFGYEQAPFNGASLLTRVEVVGVDDQSGPPRSEHLPPLTFGYTAFEPQRRRFGPVTGAGLPTRPLGDPTMAMVDLRGRGLPDIVELGATARYWRNRRRRALRSAPRDSGGAAAAPRRTGRAVHRRRRRWPGRPAGQVGDPGRLLPDDVRRRLEPALVPALPAGADRRPRRPARETGRPRRRRADRRRPLRLPLECWFNDADPRRAWQRTAVTNGPAAGIDLADPHVRLADMTGDGLQDIVLLRSGNIAYWPNLGHGRFGAPVQMRRAPRLPDGHDPRRLLLGDVDGDGVADLVYVDHGRVLLWGNQSGNAWTAAAGHRDRHPRRGRAPTPCSSPTCTAPGWPGCCSAAAPIGPARPRCGSSTSPAATSRTCSTRWTTTSAPAPRVEYVPSTQFLPRRRDRPGHPVADAAAVPGARRRPGRGARPDLLRPVDHRVPLPPRLLGRYRARVPRLRHGRATRHRNVRRRRAARRAPLAADADQDLVPPRAGRRRRGRRLDRTRPRPTSTGPTTPRCCRGPPR